MQVAAGAPQGVLPPGGPPPLPPFVPPQPQVAQAQPTTYRDKYLDPNADAFKGNFVNLYNEYSTGNTTPQDLRNAIYSDGNTGTLLHVLMHVRDASIVDPDNPGIIVAYHRLSRHNTRFGQAPTAYDNQGLAFFGDVVNGQAPLTVHVPDTSFNQLAVVQAPTAPRLQQLMAATPDDALFGPFPAGDADIEPIITRQVMVVPNRYVVPLLTQGMSPKSAYLALSGMIAQDGNQVACEELLNWLRTTLVRRTINGMPRTCSTPLATLVFANPQDQQDFAQYRLGLAQQDIPNLVPGMHHNSAVLIAQGIGTLTQEQRLAREEAAQNRLERAAPNTAGDYFGVLLPRLMRWCQVGAETDLPEIYGKLANIKKGQIRTTLQSAVEEVLAARNYLEDFPLSPTLANKITDLKWHSALKDDFTVGLNIFGFGSLDEQTMEDQRRVNKHADTLVAGDTAPTLLDIATIQDGKHDLCIPRTYADFRYCLERAEALWQVLLGSHHTVTLEHRRYRELLITQEKRLQSIAPRYGGHRYLMPALLARVIQLDLNHWFYLQMRTDAIVPMVSLTAIFYEIEREKHWEPSFPSRYLSMQDTPLPPPNEISLSGTSTTGASTLTSSATGTASGTETGATPGTGTKSTMIRNLQYKEAIFTPYKEKGFKMGKLKESLKERNIDLPSNASGRKCCLPYHVLGYCNSRCGLAADHRIHTEDEDKVLDLWCKTNYKIE